MTSLSLFPGLKPKPHRYFFFGMCTEETLPSVISFAERIGCEFLQLVPGFIQAPPSAIALQNKPQMIPVLRIFVRCLEDAWPEVEKAMVEEDAAQKRAQNRSLN